MDINSLFRFGNLAVTMLGTPQFKNMAKFVVPFLSAPAQPAEGSTGNAGASPAPQAPAAANRYPAANANPWGAGAWGAPYPPQHPGMPQFAAPRPGMPGRGGHPRLGGLEALRGFIGGGAPGQRTPGMGMQNPGMPGGQPGGQPGGIPVQNLMKYATPENWKKVMEWQKVAKQVMGMFGGSAAATTAAAAATSAAAPAGGLKTASSRGSLKTARPSRTAAKRTTKTASAARSRTSKAARSSSGSKKR